MGSRVKSARGRSGRSASSPPTYWNISRTPWRSVPTYRTATEEATIALGERLAGELPRKGVVLLIGNLGAGKTTLAKGIVRGRGVAEHDDVFRPTFTLSHENGPGPHAYHIG